MPQECTLNKLLDATPQLWRGRQANRSQRALSTGHARLDAHLPGHGWPLGAMTELISHKHGLGELSMLFPALAEMGEQGRWIILVDPPWIPYPASLQGHGLLLKRLLLVHTHSEKESLWACEQALRSGRGGAVLAWPEHKGVSLPCSRLRRKAAALNGMQGAHDPSGAARFARLTQPGSAGRLRLLSFARLRRLQLAAESSSKLAFLFRPESALQQPSPAALRLQLEPADPCRIQVNVIKCRGSRASEPVWISQPFSAYAKQPHHTGDHAPLTEHNSNTMLAGYPLPAPGSRSLHPGPKRQESADRRQRSH